MQRAARLPRSAAWVLLFPVLLSAGTAQGDARDVASYRPQQGIVFDGSYTASRSWHVGFGETGFEVEHLVPFFLCPGAPRDTLDEVLQVAPAPGVFRITATVAVFQGFRQLLRLELPPILADLTDDCGLLEELASLQDFLQDVTDRTTLILARIDVLLDELRDAYCDARTAILDAPLSESDESGYFPPLGGGGGGSPGVPAPQPCTQYRQRLDVLVARVDRMSLHQGMCAALLDLMEGVPDWVLSRVSEAGGLTADERTFALAGIDTWMATAEDERQDAASLAAEIASTVASYTLENLTQSCELCGTLGASAASLPDRLDSPLRGEADASAAVLVRWDREPLDRYVRSLWGAVRDASDRREARELAGLALRLSCIPSCRVLHVTYRGSAGIGQEYVALGAPRPRGARGAPWAVVLTVLPADAPLPNQTPSDQNLLFDAIDAFNALVVSARDDAHARRPGRHGRTRHSR